MLTAGAIPSAGALTPVLFQGDCALPALETSATKPIDAAANCPFLSRMCRRAGRDSCLLYIAPDASYYSPPERAGSLIEEAAARLQIPVGPVDLDHPILDNETVMLGLPAARFSHVWADGAPLLVFDWSGKSGDPWAAPSLKHDGLKRVAGSNTATEWVDLSSKVKLRERDTQLDPGVRNSWETDETVKVPVAGSLFVFSQVGASVPAIEQRQSKWVGKTGVGVKLKPWLLQELQVRGGPAVYYDDTEKLSPGQSPERSELFLEAVTKLPLPVVGPLNVEYTGEAVPAATPADKNQVNQDVKLALPFSNSGQFHVGAKYRWEAASATPWMDRMQLYVGVQSKW
jgi:hypothetical protein